MLFFSAKESESEKSDQEEEDTKKDKKSKKDKKDEAGSSKVVETRRNVMYRKVLRNRDSRNYGAKELEEILCQQKVISVG